MKRFNTARIWFVIAAAIVHLAAAGGKAHAQATSLFSPGCGLSGSWNSQILNLGTAGCVSGVLGVQDGGTASALESEIGRPASSFGVTCDGVTDQTAAIQAALTYGYVNKVPIRFPQWQACLFGAGNAGLTIYQGQSVDFNNAFLEPTASLTSGCAITVTGDSTSQFSSDVLEVISNLNLYGPQKNFTTGGFNYGNSSAADGLCIEGPTSYTVSNFILKQAAIEGFRNNVVIQGPNLYLIALEDVRNAGGWQSGYTFNLGSNSGEKISITHGSCFDNINPTNSSSPGSDQFHSACIRTISGATCTTSGTPCNTAYTNMDLDLYISDVSGDYNDQFIRSNGGRIYCYGCHLEDNTANPTVELTYVPGQEYPTFYMFGGAIGPGPGGCDGSNCDPTTGRTSLIQADSSSGHYRVGLYDVATDQKVNTYLFYATDALLGETVLKPSMQGKFATSSTPPISNVSTAIYNHTGDTATGGSFWLFPGWTIAGSALGYVQPAAASTLPSGISTATGTWMQVTSPIPSGGTHSVQVVCSSSCNDELTQNVGTFTPGGEVLFRSWFSVSSYTSGMMGVYVRAYAADGTPIQTKSIVTSSATFMGAIEGLEYAVPVGTATLQLTFKATNFVGTAQIASADAWQIK